MGLLPFISVSHSHIHAQARRTVHTNAASTHHTYTQRYSHTRRLSQTRQANRHLLYTSADTQTNANTHTHTHIFIPFFCHCLSFVHLRSLYSLSPGLISLYKVSISCLQGTSLPHTHRMTKEQMQSHWGQMVWETFFLQPSLFPVHLLLFQSFFVWWYQTQRRNWTFWPSRKSSIIQTQWDVI